MTREQMLQELKEKIADKTLSKGCRLKMNGSDAVLVGYTPGYGYDVYCDNLLYASQKICGFDDYCDDGVDDGVYKVIGHPISLARVLSKLGDKIVDNGGWGRALAFWDGAIYDTSHAGLNGDDKICDRNLTNPDGSDAYLDDQSDETIKALHGLRSDKTFL